MEIQEYIEKKKCLQNTILECINDDNNDIDDLLHELDDLQICDSIYEFKAFLHLIVRIINNHHRTTDFFIKFERILLHFKGNLPKNFLNYQLFNIFKSNKRILYFLIKEKIITIDQHIANIMSTNTYFLKSKYLQYFLPEIKPFLTKRLLSTIEKDVKNYIRNANLEEFFENNRKIGENDNYLEQLIRNDSIEDFISHVNKKSISLRKQIEPSIFETNTYLLKNQVTLIEYAAFYGSIQIFKYLQLNNVDLSPNLWFCVIHSKNAEMIHLLEEIFPIKNDAFFNECLVESIKCHHIDITNYIKDNLITKQYKNSFYSGIKYYNYDFFPDNLINYDAFCKLCKYDYIYIVEKIYNSDKIDINSDKNNILQIKFNEISFLKSFF